MPFFSSTEMSRIGITVVFLLAPLSGASIANAVAETSCVVVAEVPADISLSTQRLHLQPRAPLRLNRCEELKVEAGAVTACYLQHEGRRTCARIETGGGLPSAAKVLESQGVAEAFRATLAAFAKGDSQTRIGQTRGNVKLPGLPYGEIIVLGDSLEIDLAETGISDIQSLQIERIDSDSSPAVVGQLRNGKVLFSAKDLARGGKYRWRLQSVKREYTYSFNIANQAAIEQLRLKSAETVAMADSALGRSILLAELYLQNGYSFNARAELTKAGLIGY